MSAATSAHESGTPIRRRGFMRLLGGFAGLSTVAMIVTPIVGFLIPARNSQGGAGGKVAAGSLQTIPPGSAKVVAVGSKPAIVVNTGDGVKAFSAICTHLGCIVTWDGPNKVISCPCHDGKFSPATGAVLSGPPPAPLPSLTVAVEDDQIFIVTG